jgi:mono/diheme cytochrome c family protein
MTIAGTLAMKTTARTIVIAHLLVVALVFGAAALWAWLGAYNIGADDRHAPLVSTTLAYIRDRSVQAHAGQIVVPKLDDQAAIVKGAGNYDAMCAQCHLRPGLRATELSRGLYPEPPDLTRARVAPERAFWIIKHGIKASGMPAWGQSMGDADIWNMVAFLATLPDLDEQGYKAQVASSPGHSHDSAPGEAHAGQDAKPGAMPHAHPDGPRGKPHTHPPGKEHRHGTDHAH